ncbi:MAG: hypothetical protein D6805_09530 [Planctomycetota bacterium]|nr:MAG: hypothetical protein D6805_09530 [Planctomycetota bacterium]
MKRVMAFLVGLVLLFPLGLYSQQGGGKEKARRAKDPLKELGRRPEKSKWKQARIILRNLLQNPQELKRLQGEFKSLVEEAKKLGIYRVSPPKNVWESMALGLSPLKGAYTFVRKDALEIPTLLRDIQQFRTIGPDGQAYTAIRIMRTLTHAGDCYVTLQLGVKVGIRFVKNLRKYWHLGASRAIGLAIAKTGSESAKDIRQYLRWARYSHQLKLTLNYIEKNYGRLKEKAKKFLEKARAILENLSRQQYPEEFRRQKVH